MLPPEHFHTTPISGDAIAALTSAEIKRYGPKLPQLHLRFDDSVHQMFFQPQLVRDHPENRLETDGEQRQAGENEAGFGFIQADDVRQPDRQKRKAGGHDEEVEKEEQPENPEVGVVFVGTDGRVH